MKKRLIDFGCRAGGSSMGYHIAGYDVTGIDIKPQPNYPFKFYQDDFTKLSEKQIRNIRNSFDAVAGSPPCKRYTKALHGKGNHHLDLIPPFRQLCIDIGLPYIIENVQTAPLRNPVFLCGSAFGLQVRRHRGFESNIRLKGTTCRHEWQERYKPYTAIRNGPDSETKTGVINVYGKGDGTFFNGLSHLDIWRFALGINWMNSLSELSQAIPPVYTFYIGRQIITSVGD